MLNEYVFNLCVVPNTYNVHVNVYLKYTINIKMSMVVLYKVNAYIIVIDHIS